VRRGPAEQAGHDLDRRHRRILTDVSSPAGEKIRKAGEPNVQVTPDECLVVHSPCSGKFRSVNAHRLIGVDAP
jgi:hypothetical protein